MDLLELRDRKESFIARHPWETARFSVVHSILKKYFLSTHFVIADIGSGDLYFSKNLSEKYPFIKIAAVDSAFTNDWKINFLKFNPSTTFKLFNSIEDASDAMSSPVDLILLLDVIEHIADDGKFIQKLLKSGLVGLQTKLVITVPAYGSLFCSHDQFLGHFRRYSPSELKSLATRNKLEILQHGSFFLSLLIPRTFQKLKEKWFMLKPKPTTGLVEWKENRMGSSLIHFLLKSDFFLTAFVQKAIGLRLPGLSTYIICQKPA